MGVLYARVNDQWVEVAGMSPGASGAGETGPTGPPGPSGATGATGPTAVSADVGNITILGSDALIFTPITAYPRTYGEEKAWSSSGQVP